MRDTVATSPFAVETRECLARLEQIADDARRSLDRMERGIEKTNERLDTATSEARSQFGWTTGLLFSLTLATLAGFGTTFQAVSRLPHP